MYDSKMDKWSSLPKLPYCRFSLVTVPDKKQILAIGGLVKDYNTGVVKITNKVFLWDEANRKWTTPYPNMPTARCRCSSASYGSTVIVAGGVTFWDPFTMIRAVEVLHIKEHSLFTKSHWSVVERLPLILYEAIPLIVGDTLYIAIGYNEKHAPSTCNVITASLPELLQSNNKNASRGQVWNKLPDMPYSSHSITHYRGCLITLKNFGGECRADYDQPDEDKQVYQSVPLIHIYNPDTKAWNRVGEIPYEYLLGRSVHISENKILFVGGLTGMHDINTEDDDVIRNCSILTLSL